MFNLAIIMTATLILMLIVGQTLGERRQMRRASLVGAILMAVYAWFSYYATTLNGDDSFLTAMWSSAVCLPGFLGLLAGFLLGLARSRVPAG